MRRSVDPSHRPGALSSIAGALPDSLDAYPYAPSTTTRRPVKNPMGGTNSQFATGSPTASRDAAKRGSAPASSSQKPTSTGRVMARPRTHARARVDRMRYEASTPWRNDSVTAILSGTSGAVAAKRAVIDRGERPAVSNICIARKQTTPRQISAHRSGLAVTAAAPAITIGAPAMISRDRGGGARGREEPSRPATAAPVHRSQLIPGRASYSIRFPKAATAAAVAQSSLGSRFTAPDGGLASPDSSRMHS